MNRAPRIDACSSRAPLATERALSRSLPGLRTLIVPSTKSACLIVILSVATLPMTATDTSGGDDASASLSRWELRCWPAAMPQHNRRYQPDPRSRIWHLARSDAPISPADPIGDHAGVLLGRLLPREVTGVERMNLGVRDEVVEVLVVRPRHKVVIASGEDLGRRGDRREKVAQDRVLFWVMPDEASGLRETPEVVGADIVLVDFGLAVA